ncbi:hypothetical protein H0H93_010209 [Arthromyces matolae]|nr:hypothetical protein H0H93_010209 [Arthromyces matolae]
MAAQYIPPEGQTLDKATIYAALRKVVHAHSALGVRLGPADIPVFERLQKVDLSEVVEFSDSRDLAKAIESILQRKFDRSSDSPLWRLVVLGNTVCFAWHHGIGDGKSGLAFHRAFLSALQAGGSPDEDPIVVPSKDPLTPAIETLVDLSPSWGKFAVEIFGLFAPVSWTRQAGSWTGNPVPTNLTLETHARLIEFSPDVASSLLEVCRSHRATITSTVYAMALSIISEQALSDNCTTVSSAVPISLRGLSGTSDDAICNHVSALQTYPKVNPIFSWEFASEYASEIRAFVKESVGEIGMLKYLYGRYDEFFLGKLGKKRRAGFELSNVGRFKVGKGIAQTWSTGRMAFAQCDVVQGAAIKLNAVGDALGGITITVTWGANSIPDAFAEDFVVKFKNGIGKLSGETKVDSF